MFNILENFDPAQLRHNSAAHLHLLIETKKPAYADLCAWLTDPQGQVQVLLNMIDFGMGVQQAGEAAVPLFAHVEHPVRPKPACSEATKAFKSIGNRASCAEDHPRKDGCAVAW